jgi:DNA-binding transcriptional LysR family regulator
LRGTLRISLPTAAAETGVLADFVSLFRRHPELSIEMHLSDRPVDVIGRGFDAALYLTDAPDRHPGDLVLAQHPTLLAAAPSYLDRAGRPDTLEDLLDHRTIRAVSSRGKASDWLLIHEDGREEILPPAGGMFLSSEVRVLYTAAISGAGIGRVPLGFLARAANNGELEVVLPQWRFRPIMVAASVRRAGDRSSKVSALLELAMGALRRIDDFTVSVPLEEHYRRQLTQPDSALSAADTPIDDAMIAEYKAWTI